MIESAMLLFLVVDPFGNLPFVLAVAGRQAPDRYRRTILREGALAWGVLTGFAAIGDRILALLRIEPPSLQVAGGVVLFLISLRMVFSPPGRILDEAYDGDPWLFPIAIPSLAGPSAMTTVVLLHSQQGLPFIGLIASLTVVFLVTTTIFLLGHRISRRLGPRGLNAIEKLMGLLLNLLSVNMILVGIRDFLAA